MGWKEDLAALYSGIPGPAVTAATAPLVLAGGVVSLPASSPTNDGYMTAAQAEALESATGGAVDFAAVQAALADADSAIDVASQQITHLGAPGASHHAARLEDVTDAIATAEAYTDAAVAGIGGAPSRIVALDAHDIAEWKLDDAAEPWADGVGSLSLTGYGGLGDHAPAITDGGSIRGDRSVFCDGNLDTGLRSDNTMVGEESAGTVHGWALLTQEPGALFTKDEGSSIYLRTTGSGPAASYELLAKIGDSGEISVAPTRYRALVHSGAWTHFAMTWSGGVATVYVNGVKLPTTLSYSSITWGAGRWRLGKTDYLGSLSGLMASWRVCNVARSAAYIDEVYRRAVGRWP